MGFKKVVALVAASLTMSVLPAASPSADAATGVCSGVRYCKLVSRADIDGDGRADQVGVVQKSRDPRGEKVTVRVRTAKGRTMATSHKTYWYGSSWHGAAWIDGVPGRELVLGTSVGAHLMIFRVITVRGGKLVTLKAPGNQSRWYIDSSYSFNEGWTRSVSKGVVSMTYKGSVRMNSSRHRLVTTRSTWQGGWRLVTTRTTTVSNSVAGPIGGWRVSGLRRFPTLR